MDCDKTITSEGELVGMVPESGLEAALGCPCRILSPRG